MAIPITSITIFSLADVALKGYVVEFIHKGVKFKVIPEGPADKLSNITPLQFVNPDCHLESEGAELQAEMEKEWEKDWSQL